MLIFQEDTFQREKMETCMGDSWTKSRGFQLMRTAAATELPSSHLLLFPASSKSPFCKQSIISH